MAIARILCVVSLRIELYDQADTADARLSIEGKLLANATKAWDAFKSAFTSDQDQSTSIALDNDPAPLTEEDHGTGNGRPFFVLPDVLPLDWAVSFNSFRHADELECAIPLDLLPVPLDAVRSVSCTAAVRHLDADAWSTCVVDGAGPAAAGISTALDDADFAGVCVTLSQHIGTDGIPSVKLKFVDFLGLLAAKHPLAGKELHSDLPISDSINDFLKGSAAEGLVAKWVDPDNAEPTVGKHLPKLTKKRGGTKSSKVAHAKQTYLDAIVEECAKVGVVPRVNVGRIELAYAGTMYEGKDRGMAPKATLLLGRTLEDFGAEHDLVGLHTKSVMVTTYNPDTGQTYSARWPADAKTVTPIVGKPGEPPVLPPLAANIGLPGHEELDESIVLIPVAPVADPAVLPKVAEAIFLERTRQRVRYHVKTHAPWSDPDDATSPDVLALRAGDVVEFGVVPIADADLLPASVRILSGEVGEKGIASLLSSAGVAADVASRAASAIGRLPRTTRWRVDELHVAGGNGKPAELEIKLINYTVIVSDLKAKADGTPPDEVVTKLEGQADLVVGMTRDAVNDLFARARQQVDDSDADDDAKAQAKARLDEMQKQALKGK